MTHLNTKMSHYLKCFLFKKQPMATRSISFDAKGTTKPKALGAPELKQHGLRAGRFEALHELDCPRRLRGANSLTALRAGVRRLVGGTAQGTRGSDTAEGRKKHHTR